MASNTQDSLYNFFTGVFEGKGLDIGALIQNLAGSTNSTAQPQSGGGGIGSIASTVLKSAFGVVPLIGGILGLFGGSESATPPPLVKYELPPAISFDSADVSSGIAMADYDQTGSPRAFTPQTQEANSGLQAASAGSSSTQQITVNIQAMDSRSFLDRSSEIAAAVREAMLNLNSINDVVNDL